MTIGSFSDSPLVSILINNHNYGRFLREAIDGALGQTYPNTEVVVVDDGSTDDSREVIASYGDTIVPVLKENGGQASTFNAGFAASGGDIICFLDSDDVFLPEKVSEVVGVFKSHPDAGWCFHNLRLMDTTGTLLEYDYGPPRRSQEYDFRATVAKGKLSFDLPATSGICFTRSLLKQILPMPEAPAIPTSADAYVKFSAVALGKGFFIGKELSLQRIHGENALTLRDDRQQVRARRKVLTAYWLRRESSLLAKLANKLFAQGVGLYLRSGGVAHEYREVVRDYLASTSTLEKFEIGLRSLYHYLKRP